MFASQLIAPYFLISYLILFLAWVLSGPVVASILGILAGVVVLYLYLSLQQPIIFIQGAYYGVIFSLIIVYLRWMQKRVHDKEIQREKITEEITLTDEEIAKKNALEHALEEKKQHFIDLQKYSAELKGIVEMDQVLQRVVAQACKILPKAKRCCLYLVNESKQELELVSSTHAMSELVREKDGTVFDHWVMKKSQPVIVEDSFVDFRFPTEPKSDFIHLRALCASPLMTENRVLGIIRVSSDKPGVFETDDLRLLDVFSGLAAVNLKNILLYKKMEELAIQDSLTGFYLNRFFQERLQTEIQRAKVNRKVFSIILLDIDHFKKYNDEYGHAAGDIVLKSTAAVIANCLGNADLVARYGGEEFIILLANKNKTEALDLAEKIREDVEKNKLIIRRVEGSVTISLGVASFPADGAVREELIKIADRNLYEAKRNGRNRVCGIH